MVPRKSLTAGLTVLGIAALCAAVFWLNFNKATTKFRPKFQKGMTYATWNKDALGSQFSDVSLERLKATNTEWVAFVPTWYQAEYNSTKIAPTSKTPTDESLLHAMARARELGFKIMLKPHVDLSEGAAINWRGEIDFPNAEAWRPWFETYTDFILHYATMAHQQQVDLFCVGTELTNAAAWHEAQWRDIIQRVRSVYTGPLTYAANWNEEYQLIKFWDALDYAGIDPYFPLSEEDAPTLIQLREGWLKIMPDLEAWQKRINKPVIFTEIGYKSVDGATRRPWEDAANPLNAELQRDAYQALLELFWSKPWFFGVYWWHWGTHEKMGGEQHRGFTPQNKPAQALLTEWYAKRMVARRWPLPTEH